MTSDEQLIRVDGRELKLSNLNKVLWPKEKITKAEVIKYYAEIGGHMIAFIKDRPLMAQRYPHGIQSEYFVQKHFLAIPDWVKRFSFKSRRSGD
jgi:bifunctional non-homologous end joining protein LigD